MKTALLSFAFLLTGMTLLAQSPSTVQGYPRMANQRNLKTIQKSRASSAGQQSFWLNYGQLEDSLKGGISVLNGNYLFPDSSVIVSFGTAWDRPWIHCISDVLDVLYMDFKNIKGFNWSTFNNFSVDSMSVLYGYERHSASSVVDTLIVNLYSNADPTNLRTGRWTGATGWETNYNVDTLFVKLQKYSYVTNAPIATGMQTFKIPLTEKDTAVVNWGLKAFNTNAFAVPGGKLVCSSVSFKPGYTYAAGDTLAKKGQNIFNFASYEENGANTFPSYDKGQWNNSGIITNGVRFNKDHLGWDSTFIPNYLFTQIYGLEHHQISYKVTSTNLGIVENEAAGMKFFQNYPNPCSQQTSIRYELSNQSAVRFELSDITGRLVYSSEEGMQSAGIHSFNVDVSGFSQGVYFCTLRAGNQPTLSQRLVIVR
ncbi:MAG TPA: T9SS type A sorting domain-containing protein [Bacteroidia bacterium]|nr:T9SS type A sorting domain-containing protein [Bacteroidia bacterium]